MWVDIHSHILPGLDDGANCESQSIRMARMAAQDGTRLVVCTPHWVPGLYPTDRDRILQEVIYLNERLRREGILLKLCPGQEIRLDVSIPARLSEGSLLTINDTGRYALIELPLQGLPPKVEGFLCQLQTEGITPILAHAERVSPLRQEPERLYRWVRAGLLAQVTAGSLLGHYGQELKEYSIWLLKQRMAHMVGSDAHDLEGRPPGLSQAKALVEDLLGEEVARDLFRNVPEAVVRGDPVEMAPPLPWQVGRARYGFLKRLVRAG